MEVRECECVSVSVFPSDLPPFPPPSVADGVTAGQRFALSPRVFSSSSLLLELRDPRAERVVRRPYLLVKEVASPERCGAEAGEERSYAIQQTAAAGGGGGGSLGDCGGGSGGRGQGAGTENTGAGHGEVGATEGGEKERHCGDGDVEDGTHGRGY